MVDSNSYNIIKEIKQYAKDEKIPIMHYIFAEEHLINKTLE